LTGPLDILDDPEEEGLPPEDEQEYRRKAIRLFIYALGIIAILTYRFSMIGGLRAMRMLGLTGLERLFYLGLAGVWCFAGLGAYYGLLALRRNEPRTVWLAISLAGNVLLFGLATWQLALFYLYG
jgi:hypothetical protein